MSNLPETYADDTAKSRRLATLRVLYENEGSANESLLRVALHQLGFRGRFQTEEALAGDIAVLKAELLIEEDSYQGKVRTLVITKRGVAFLQRRIEPVDGIEYPDVA
ncbi:Uncharacterised protein [Starkeya nomas]|uniref:Uncharacterized protein n=1 Tax=Starkeya nomas TaxID=2666134 RepID=A0A5S9R581_9HYPH|nr:hypothetical protein [Starkeya nomas]CAA0130473.1 Uncharacterised protein [Starkeya nomas]